VSRGGLLLQLLRLLLLLERCDEIAEVLARARSVRQNGAQAAHQRSGLRERRRRLVVHESHQHAQTCKATPDTLRNAKVAE
jgi:hypothetical protein